MGVSALGTARPRGERRRRELVQAGVELLGEVGWSGLTSRAIAQRAGAPPGLVHYHFGGLPQLKRAVVAAVMTDAVEPVLEVLTASPSWSEGVAVVIEASQDLTPAEARVTAELMSASLHDPEVAALMRGAQAELRGRLSRWLAGLGVEEPEGMAVLTSAMLDGLVLHRLIDERLPLSDAANALSGMRPTPRRR